MKKVYLSVCISFLISNSANAGQTYGFYFGAGGEPENKKQTIFFEDLETINKIANQKKWTMSYLHDGGHQVDDSWVDKNIQSPKAKFSKEEFEKTLSKAESNIQKGNIKPGDQVLVYINTHGSPKEGNNPTHNIWTNNGPVEISRLKKLRDMAEEKGVRLAIVDTSCYSGESLELATSQTCVISMSDHTVANNLDSSKFLEALSGERNLENAFFIGRSNDSISPSQPQISTDTGQLVRKKMKPFAGSLRKTSDLVTADRLEDLCLYRRKNIDELAKFAKDLDSTSELNNDPKIQEAKKIISEHRKKEAEISNVADEIKKLDTDICFKLKSGMDVCKSPSSMEFALQYHQGEIKNKKDKLGISKEIVGGLTQAMMSKKYLSYISESEKVKQIAKKMDDDRGKIASLEKVLYNKYYLSLTPKNGSSNPCRDFKL